VAAKVPTAGLAVEAVAWFAVGGAAGHLLEGMGPATNIWCQSLHNNSLETKIKRDQRACCLRKALGKFRRGVHLLRKHRLIGFFVTL
jgi:hypothetical protein